MDDAPLTRPREMHYLHSQYHNPTRPKCLPRVCLLTVHYFTVHVAQESPLINHQFTM